MAPVIRFAAFKYKPGVTDEQKREALKGLLALYTELDDLVDGPPQAGSNNSAEPFGHGFDLGFTTRFKSKEARDAFVEHPKHREYQVTVVPLVEDVMIYDFEPGVHNY